MVGLQIKRAKEVIKMTENQMKELNELFGELNESFGEFRDGIIALSEAFQKHFESLREDAFETWEQVKELMEIHEECLEESIERDFLRSTWIVQMDTRKKCQVLNRRPAVIVRRINM